MNQLKEWFASLAPRERLAVIAGGAAIVVGLFYFALWAPLNASLANARSQLSGTAEQASWMLGIRNEARSLRASGGGQSAQIRGKNDSLLTIIDRTSRKNGLGDAVQRIQPANNNKATVTLNQAGFDDMIYWLHTLETDYGVSVTEMTVNRQDKPGTIQARLTLSRSVS